MLLELSIFVFVKDFLKEIDDFQLEEVVPCEDLNKIYDLGEAARSAKGGIQFVLLELDHLVDELDSVESLRTQRNVLLGVQGGSLKGTSNL